MVGLLNVVSVSDVSVDSVTVVLGSEGVDEEEAVEVGEEDSV